MELRGGKVKDRQAEERVAPRRRVWAPRGERAPAQHGRPAAADPRPSPAASPSVRSGRRAAGGRRELPSCCVCREEIEGERKYVTCKADRHHVCADCLQGLILMEATSQRLRQTNGQIPCPHKANLRYLDRCPSEAWKLQDIKSALTAETLTAFAEAVNGVLQVYFQRENRRQVAHVHGRSVEERVDQYRQDLVENVLTLHCPRCSAVFLEYDGCDALVCGLCGCGFCSLCLMDCGMDAHTHVGREHGTYFGGIQRFREWHKDRRRRGSLAFLLNLPEPIEVRLQVLRACHKDLRDLGIDAADLRTRLLLSEQAVPLGPTQRLAFRVGMQGRWLARGMLHWGPLLLLVCMCVSALYYTGHAFAVCVATHGPWLIAVAKARARREYAVLTAAYWRLWTTCVVPLWWWCMRTYAHCVSYLPTLKPWHTFVLGMAAAALLMLLGPRVVRWWRIRRWRAVHNRWQNQRHNAHYGVDNRHQFNHNNNHQNQHFNFAAAVPRRRNDAWNRQNVAW